MQIDVARVLGLVTRSVRNFEKDGKAASAVTLSRRYDTSVDDLWDALTSKERIPRWFLPVEGDLQLGGKYQLKGNAGGTITACAPPRHFTATWEFGGGTSWIDVSLAAERGVGSSRRRPGIGYRIPAPGCSRNPVDDLRNAGVDTCGSG